MLFSRSVWIWLACLLVALTVVGNANAEAASMVFLNGVPTPVTFNDGDSFRVLEGPLEGSKARLAGFNTLESHGPVHQWGTWHAKELYAIAKIATLNARRGVWHCESKDMARDGYGRILWDCPDLREDQVRNGFAHALAVDGPADPKSLAAQREAIRYRRGIWAHGVPTYVLTSIHSADEGAGPKTYNRLVSSVDGHSEKWHHQALFHECQNVCHRPTELPLQDALAVARELRADPGLRRALDGLDDIIIALSVNDFIQTGKVPQVADEAGDRALERRLAQMKKAGRFKGARETAGSCMIHVDFKRRYKAPKPACLKW